MSSRCALTPLQVAKIICYNKSKTLARSLVKVLLPNTVTLEPPAIQGVTYHVYDVKAPLPDEHHDAEVLAVWGNPAARLKEAARVLGKLRLVQSLAAGVDAIMKAGFPEEVPVSSGRSLHDETVAEHTLALLLSAARRLHEMRDAQAERRWPGHLGGIQPVDPPGVFTTLKGAMITIWGFGSIATTLAPHLRALGANVQGVARSAGERHGFPVHAETDIEQLLPETDALVMILPSTPDTKNALDARKMARLPRHAWVVNVGRGGTLDEQALAHALEQGQLAGAALDVFETEPLPEDSPLWALPNVIISPHAAGGRPRGAAELIARNVHHLLADESLENVVDRNKGY
jgi:phosphoglycerate dehydrogenase-like enzyme